MVVRFHFLHDVWDIKDVEALDNSEHFYDVEHVLTISVQPHHLERDQAHQILDEIGGNVSDRNLGQSLTGFYWHSILYSTKNFKNYVIMWTRNTASKLESMICSLRK